MKQLLLGLLGLFGYGKTNRQATQTDSAGLATDLSGKTLDCAYDENLFKTFASHATPQQLATVKIQYVFKTDTTGEVRIYIGEELQVIPFSWKVEGDTLLLTSDHKSYTALQVKKESTGYVFSNSKVRVLLTSSY